MDDFWKRVYDVMMTPLPPPKQLELDRLFEALRSVKEAVPSEIGELPVAPEWVQRYARERGLDRPRVPAQPPSIAQPSSQSQAGLWEFLHPEGVGNTSRSFNAIYPPLRPSR